VTVITTSNRPPRDLYKDGLEPRALPAFHRVVERELEVLPLNGPDGLPARAARRHPHLARAERAGGDAGAQHRFLPAHRLFGGRPGERPAEDIAVQGGRTLHVPKSLKGVAVFSFKRLCGEARGAPDYLAIARRYHTIILVGIPGWVPRTATKPRAS
jgi:cell division protein ZapE